MLLQRLKMFTVFNKRGLVYFCVFCMVCLSLLITSELLFAQSIDNNQVTPKNMFFSSVFFKVSIGIIVCIIAFTMYKCYKKELIVYHSFTDLLSSFLIFFSPIILLIIFNLVFDNFKQRSFYTFLIIFSCLTSIPFLIFSIKCSINYNDKLFNIILSSLTKIFIPLLIIIAYILANVSRDRRKGEWRSTYERRTHKENMAKVAAVTAVILVLITNKSFKSIRGR
ncbi:MAG: hypothetical protein LBS60_00455 [Deltaproteobacteria bacterium]|jgi:hypothetical protein|nr:hypothetical protein [Deltaproteobacteria bacterium]